MKPLKRKKYKADIYRDLFTHCCFPDCAGYSEVVHHMLPLSKGGKDTYINFICLCGKHHRKFKLHSNCEEKQTELLTYKFYEEFTILGFTSDIPEKEFLSKITHRRTEGEQPSLDSETEEKSLTMENKRETIHSYGQVKRRRALKSPKPPKPQKQWRCHWCGEIIDADGKRKYCSDGCYGEYLRHCSWIRWLSDIVATKEIYYTPSRFKSLRRYLEYHNNHFEIMGGLYSISIQGKNIAFNIPSGDYWLLMPGKYLSGDVLIVEHNK